MGAFAQRETFCGPLMEDVAFALIDGVKDNNLHLRLFLETL